MTLPSWPLERLASCPSTMEEARRRARAGAPHGTTVVAQRQMAGHGTKGRAWHSPEGGLYLSVVLRGLRDPHLLTLALGNAVADALEVAGVEPRLKWVNDVLVGRRKVAGILVEAESTGDRIDFLVAGIGVNANGDPATFPADLQATATTLEKELGCATCVPDLEALLLADVQRWVDAVAQGRDAEVLAAYRARDALPGARVRVVADGEASEGTAEGIDGSGRLLVRSGGVQRAVLAGTVQVLG